MENFNFTPFDNVPDNDIPSDDMEDVTPLDTDNITLFNLSIPEEDLTNEMNPTDEESIDKDSTGENLPERTNEVSIFFKIATLYI